MPGLTRLEEKLGDALGLARATQHAIERLGGTIGEDIASALVEMRDEARETAAQCERVIASLDAQAPAIEARARETTGQAGQMMSTYLGEGADGIDGIDGLQFLGVLEAAEAGHWEVLDAMAESADRADIADLVARALPVQRRHLDTARGCVVALARAAGAAPGRSA